MSGLDQPPVASGRLKKLAKSNSFSPVHRQLFKKPRQHINLRDSSNNFISITYSSCHDVMILQISTVQLVSS